MLYLYNCRSVRGKTIGAAGIGPVGIVVGRMSCHLTDRQGQTKKGTTAILTTVTFSFRDGILSSYIGSGFHNDHKTIHPKQKIPPRHGQENWYG